VIVVVHLLLFGGVLSLLSAVVLLGSWAVDPRIWGQEVGAKPEYQNRSGAALTVVILLVVQIGTMVFATSRFADVTQHLTFGRALLLNYAYYQVFNLFDLLVIDWLIYLQLKPRFMRPDYLPVAGFSEHAIGFRNGLFVALVPAAVSSGIWLLLAG
jgi:hypothetical protein